MAQDREKALRLLESGTVERGRTGESTRARPWGGNARGAGTEAYNRDGASRPRHSGMGIFRSRKGHRRGFSFLGRSDETRETGVGGWRWHGNRRRLGEIGAEDLGANGTDCRGWWGGEQVKPHQQGNRRGDRECIRTKRLTWTELVPEGSWEPGSRAQWLDGSAKPSENRRLMPQAR